MGDKGTHAKTRSLDKPIEYAKELALEGLESRPSIYLSILSFVHKVNRFK